MKEIRTEKEVWKYINRERKEKGISERGNNNTRMGRGLHETVGREKEGRKSRKRNEEEADGARGNRGRLQMTKCCKSVINNILGEIVVHLRIVAMTFARGEVTRLSQQKKRNGPILVAEGKQ
jgi:hypothetical protein